jgi:hypothetical protein
VTTPTNIPSYLSEGQFRVYEPHITRGVSAFPAETKFTAEDFRGADGKPLSGNTFAARFRDAITSLKRFKWTPTTVDVDKLWQISGEFAIGFDADGAVWFRNRGKKGRPTHLTEEAKERKIQALVGAHIKTEWDAASTDEVKALCVLLHGGKVIGPILMNGPIFHTLVEEMEAYYNVAFVFDSANNKTIIT